MCGFSSTNGERLARVRGVLARVAAPLTRVLTRLTRVAAPLGRVTAPLARVTTPLVRVHVALLALIWFGAALATTLWLWGLNPLVFLGDEAVNRMAADV